MKTVTLQADEHLLAAAEERARLEHTTLDEQFQHWLADYAREVRQAESAMAVVAELQQKLRTGGHHFTREEMNERCCR